MISRLVHLHALETCEKLDAAFAYGWENPNSKVGSQQVDQQHRANTSIWVFPEKSKFTKFIEQLTKCYTLTHKIRYYCNYLCFFIQ